MRETKLNYKKLAIISLLGLIGGLLVGASNYMLFYAYTDHVSDLFFLTGGALSVDSNNYMYIALLMIAGILLVSIQLSRLGDAVPNQQFNKLYHILCGFVSFAWFAGESFVLYTVGIAKYLESDLTTGVECAEKFYTSFNYINIISYVVLGVFFVFLAYLLASSSTSLPSILVINNPIIYYCVLYGISKVIPESPLQIAFHQSLFAMSTILFFLVFIIYGIIKDHKEKSWYHY